MNIKVIKRDNSLEDFDINKIKKVVKAAGMNDIQTEKLAEEVISWVNSLKEGSKVSSLTIKDMLIDRMKTINEQAANLFAWYETTLDE